MPAETGAFSPLVAAAAVCHARFNEAPAAWQLCGRPVKLTRGRLILAAPRKRMADTGLYCMLDMTSLAGGLEHER